MGRGSVGVGGVDDQEHQVTVGPSLGKYSEGGLGWEDHNVPLKLVGRDPLRPLHLPLDGSVEVGGKSSEVPVPTTERRGSGSAPPVREGSFEG